MGCSSYFVDPDIAKILQSLDEKVVEIDKTFKTDAEEAKNKLDIEINSRHEELEKLKKRKEEITEEKLKELNKKELEKEIEILSNGVNKMHFIFEAGLELAEPFRKVTIDKLLEKAKRVPEMARAKINSEIEEVKSLQIKDFIDSSQGKSLKVALTKKGLSVTLLIGVKKDIMKNRGKRREAERKEFDIKKNEFEKEDICQLKLDLMKLIKNEIKDDKDDNKSFKDYVRDKIYEEIFSDEKVC